MGCLPSKSSKEVDKQGSHTPSMTPQIGCAGVSMQQQQQSQQLTSKLLSIQIHDPKTQKTLELVYSKSSSKPSRSSMKNCTSGFEDYLMNIMNSAFFANEKNAHIDVCFTSLYNQKTDRYHYYLHRLLNVEVEDIEHPYNGKLWVLYINDEQVDWDAVVNQNLKHDLTKQSILTWKYERLNHIPVSHSQSQPQNLDFLKKKGEEQEVSPQQQADSQATPKQIDRVDQQPPSLLVNNLSQIHQYKQEYITQLAEEVEEVEGGDNQKEFTSEVEEEEKRQGNYAFPTEAAMQTDQINDLQTVALDSLPSEDAHILDHYLIYPAETKLSKTAEEQL